MKKREWRKIQNEDELEIKEKRIFFQKKKQEQDGELNNRNERNQRENNILELGKKKNIEEER